LVAKIARPAWHFVLRPAAAIADMTARFSTERLTPGNLGLELTTLLALLAVSTFSFFLLGDVIEQPGEPRIDRWAEDVANRLNTDVLVSIAKLVTQLGSLAAAAIAVVLTAGWALTRRRFIDVGTLVLGLGLSYAAVHVTKNAYDRPRPANPLVATDLSSFPSGHACYAVTLVACATLLVRGGVGWAARVAAVTVAVIIVAVVGVTRVYLRAHYLTDVLGGISLSVAIWSFMGIFALFAGRVRHNTSE
jgi:undecaprenyl-diphosphatase